jgi:hypothetical protein
LDIDLDDDWSDASDIRVRISRHAAPSNAGSTSSWSEDAVFVVFGIGQNDPRLVTLSDIGLGCAEIIQTSHFSFLVDRRRSRWSWLLVVLVSGVRAKQQDETRRTAGLVGRRSDLELLRIVVHDDPAQSRRTIVPAPPDLLSRASLPQYEFR